VVDVKTDEPRNIKSSTLDETVTDEICFYFVVKGIDGCADEFRNTLVQQVDIKTQPPISEALIAKIRSN